MLAKLKSRGLSGLAVRQRRWTSNEFEHPSFDDDGHVQPLSSPSQSNHADATATSSPLTPLASSPAHVATTDGEYDLQQPLVKSSGVVPLATPGSNDAAVARDVAPAGVPVKSGVSSATKKGFGALLRASKSGELERVAATIPADDATASVSHLITSAADCIAPHVAGLCASALQIFEFFPFLALRRCFIFFRSCCVEDRDYDNHQLAHQRRLTAPHSQSIAISMHSRFSDCQFAATS
jgi:hypothetical protein